MYANASALPLWVWIEYAPGMMPRYIQLNLIALSLHAPPAFRLEIVNHSNFRRHVPDLPEEFERLPYAVASSDFARIALLAVHGGLYLDADFLVQKSLVPLRELLERYETISYASKGQNCSAGRFSANFVAAQPKSKLWAASWRSLKTQMKRPCGLPRRYRICCYAPNGTAAQCRVPWALTTAISDPIAKSLAAYGKLSLFCFSGLESFTPWADQQMHICTRQWNIAALRLKRGSAHEGHRRHLNSTQPGHRQLLDESAYADDDRDESRRRAEEDDVAPSVASGGAGPAGNVSEPKYMCGQLSCTKHGADLRCGHSIAHNFFERLTYHLFESINGKVLSTHPQIEASPIVAGALYTRALRHAKELPPPFAMNQRVQTRPGEGDAVYS